MAQKRVLVAGSLVLDIVAAVAQSADTSMLFAQGKQTELENVELYLGGEVGNLGIALSRLGMPVTLVSKVGDDLCGKIMQGLLAKLDIPARIKIEAGMKSTVSVCLTVPGRDKITFHRHGASQTFIADDIPDELLAQTDLFHFGYPPTMESLYEHQGAQLLKLLRKAKEAGATTALDMSLPGLASAAGQVCWRPILEQALPYIDIFLPSLEESIFLWDRERYVELVQKTKDDNMMDHLTDEDAGALAAEMLQKGAKIVLLKSGKRGMYLRTANRLRDMGRAAPSDIAAWEGRELWEAPCDVPHIHSTTGAGDIAIAGFLAAFLSGCGPQQTLQIASYAAARCIEGYDTSGSLGDLEQVMRDYRRYEKLPVTLTGQNWKKNGWPGQWTGRHDMAAAQEGTETGDETASAVRRSALGRSVRSF